MSLSKFSPLIFLLSSYLFVGRTTFADEGGILIFDDYTTDSDEYVTNAERVLPNEYPWLARSVQGRSRSRCGGSLVAPDFVLTSGSCMFEGFSSKDGVLPFALDNSGYDIGALCDGRDNCGQDVDRKILVEDFYIHPEFDSSTGDWDLALVRLKSVSTLPYVEMDDGSLSFESGGSVTTVGFGNGLPGDDDGYASKASKNLMRSKAPHITNEECRELFNDDPTVTESQMCIQKARHGSDPGGPILDDRSGMLIGVAANGNDGLRRKGPTVHSRIGAARGWIDETVCGNSTARDGLSFCAPMSYPGTVASHCDLNEYEAKIVVRTDAFGHEENSWSLEDAQTNRMVLEVPLTAAGPSQTRTDLVCLEKKACYRFKIRDNLGDGMCCGLYGNGHYGIYSNNVKMAKGGVFGSEAVEMIGACSNREARTCYKDEASLEVRVKTDNYGGETSYELDMCGRVAAKTSSELYLDDKVYVDSWCVKKGQCYDFKIKDDHGDGICCSSGRGHYTVRVDGIIMAEGGDFLHQESKRICTTLGTCDTQLKIKIKMDERSADNDSISWTLQESSNIILYGNNLEPAKIHEIVMPTCTDKCYQFSIYDNSGNGLCCDNREGYYRLFMNGTQVAQGDSFGYSDTVEICGADAKCSDNLGVFNTAKNKRKTCKWLRNQGKLKIDRFCNHLNKFNAVDLCLKTCKSCQERIMSF